MSDNIVKAAGMGAAVGAAGGPVGIIIGVAAGICVGGAICWLVRGKKENTRHAQNQALISSLEKRLRRNEERLRDTTSLAAQEIERLRMENAQIRSEIRRAKEAA